VEDCHLPAAGSSKIVEEFLDEHSVSVALHSEQTIKVVLAAVRTDRAGWMTFFVDARHENIIAVGAGNFAVMAKQCGRHRTSRNDIRFGRKRSKKQDAKA
jgi:hypothetical protein